MRSLPDRIRHSVLFELIGILATAFGGALLTGHSPFDMGSMAVIFSLLAMVWNFLFNLLFDLWDRKYRKMAPRGFLLRSVHAVLFEAGMLISGIFIVAYWLNVGYWEAFLLDAGFSVFFLIYAFVYNWLYDLVFPVPRYV